MHLTFQDADGTITMTGSESTGVNVLSQGGNGGQAGPDGAGASAGNLGPAGGAGGGAAGRMYLDTSVETTIDSSATAMMLESTGGDSGLVNHVPLAAGPGGVGGLAADIEFNLNPSGATSTGVWNLTTTDEKSIALHLTSTGGTGGNGGDGPRDTGWGGNGGGGNISIHQGAHVLTLEGADSKGLQVVTRGGTGGDPGLPRRLSIVLVGRGRREQSHAGWKLVDYRDVSPWYRGGSYRVDRRRRYNRRRHHLHDEFRRRRWKRRRWRRTGVDYQSTVWRQWWRWRRQRPCRAVVP